MKKMTRRTNKAAIRKKQLLDEEQRLRDVPLALKVESHGCNVSLFQHGICIGANKLMNSVVEQAFKDPTTGNKTGVKRGVYNNLLSLDESALTKRQC